MCLFDFSGFFIIEDPHWDQQWLYQALVSILNILQFFQTASVLRVAATSVSASNILASSHFCELESKGIMAMGWWIS